MTYTVDSPFVQCLIPFMIERGPFKSYWHLMTEFNKEYPQNKCTKPMIGNAFSDMRRDPDQFGGSPNRCGPGGSSYGYGSNYFMFQPNVLVLDHKQEKETGDHFQDSMRFLYACMRNAIRQIDRWLVKGGNAMQRAMWRGLRPAAVMVADTIKEIAEAKPEIGTAA